MSAKQQTAMTFGSLFAGIGGFDCGFERAGMRCVWQVERDRQCLELLARKWPNIRRVNDVVRARYATESKYAERMDTEPLVRPDIICGGFPCQDLSVAGKRRGLAGGRSGLFWTMRRIIGLLKPTWFVIENVPGLLSSNGGRDMGAVIGSLVDSGYGVAWRVLDSQFFGLAQRRKRVFIVGHLGDVRRAGAVLFDGESMCRDSPPSREAREAVAGTLESRTNGGGFPGSDGAMSGHVVAATLRSRQSKPGVSMPGRGGEDDQNLVVAMTLNAKNGKRYDAESETLLPFTFQPRFARNGRGGPSDVVEALTASESGTHGDSKPHVCVGFQSSQSGFREVETHATLDSNNGSRRHNGVATRQGVRRLIPIECERLQGFPDGWTAGYCGDQSSIGMTWENLNAILPSVDDRLLTDNKASASCTISDCENTEVSIFRSDRISPSTNAKSVTGLLEKSDREAYVLATTNRGSGMAILCDQTGILRSDQQKQKGEPGSIGKVWRLRLADSFSPERLSTISTWILAIMRTRTCISAKATQNTCAFMLHWNEPQRNCSPKDLFVLRVADTKLFSDSARYRMLGNAVSVPVIEWIARRIALVEANY